MTNRTTFNGIVSLLGSGRRQSVTVSFQNPATACFAQRTLVRCFSFSFHWSLAHFTFLRSHRCTLAQEEVCCGCDCGSTQLGWAADLPCKHATPIASPQSGWWHPSCLWSLTLCGLVQNKNIQAVQFHTHPQAHGKSNL